jgi:phospholipid/cholesterol/gamma-HCH transport system substrate-binding protein
LNKQAPSTGRILTMVAFAGSCVGLLLFLWISFGGSIPLAPQGYRLHAEFNDAVQLGIQSDVRISGVSVGKVVDVSLDSHTGLTNALIQFDSRYAPRPADTRAILRAKSLLGETYIELSPGSQNGPKLPDGGTIPRTSIAPTVQLDQILSTFDPATRRAFSTWQQQDAIALTNRGEDFNAAFAELYPFATNVDAVLNALNRDSAERGVRRDCGAEHRAGQRDPRIPRVHGGAATDGRPRKRVRNGRQAADR